MKFEVETNRLCADLRSQEIGRREFVDGCLRLVCYQVGCSRAGLWVFRDPQGAEPHDGQAGDTKAEEVLHCLGNYDRQLDQILHVHYKVSGKTQSFHEALRANGHVLAHDTSTHPATRDFYELTLRSANIRSLIASRFGINGQIFGAFICASVDVQVQWTSRQLAVLTNAGSRMAIALAADSESGVDTFFAEL